MKSFIASIIGLLAIPYCVLAADSPAEFSPDSRLLVLVRSQTEIWDVQTGRLESMLPTYCGAGLQVMDDKRLVCLSNDIAIWNWPAKTKLAATQIATGVWVRPVAYDRKQQLLVLQEGIASHRITPDKFVILLYKLGSQVELLARFEIKGPTQPFRLAASPDARWVAATFHNSPVIKLVSLKDRTEYEIKAPQQYVDYVLFSPDGRTLVYTLGNTLGFIDTRTRTIRTNGTLLPGEGARGHAEPVQFTPDGARLIVKNYGTYATFNVASGEVISHTPQIGNVYASALSDDGRTVLLQPERPYTIQAWSIEDGRHLADLCDADCRNMGPVISRLKFSPDGKHVLLGVENFHSGLKPDWVGLSLWDFEQRRPKFVLDPNRPEGAPVSASAAATAAAPSPKIQLDLPSSGSEHAWAHAGGISAVMTAPSGNVIITAGGDSTIKVWDVKRAMLVRTVSTEHPVSSVLVSPTGEFVTAAMVGGDIVSWRLNDWTMMPKFSTQQGGISAFRYVGSNILAIAGTNRKIMIVNLADHRVVKELIHTSDVHISDGMGNTRVERSTQPDTVDFLEVSPDGRYLYSRSRTGRLLWDTRTWTEVPFPEDLKTFGGQFVGRDWIVSSTTNVNTHTVTLWDRTKKNTVVELDQYNFDDTKKRMNEQDVYFGVETAVDPSGRFAAVCIGERISLWDIGTKTKAKVFYLPLPTGLAWTATGKYLVIRTAQRKLLVWSAETMAPVYYLRDLAVPQ